ncbi:MAG: gliding motility protein GldM [Marinilabiliales bacterium]|nr:MAG: gliding motility protein GldM [Marinilabiliales bacterium]
MAGGKETPRQKLIGMMYLVLMAMLALNVSVEVLDAFVVVDEGLTKTTENFTQQNEAIYREFARRMAENPVRVRPWKEQADEVKERADALFSEIQDLKHQIVFRAEGTNTDAIDDDGRIIGANIRAKENTNPPAQVMLFPEGNMVATQLKNSIAGFREFLTGIADPRDEGIIQAIETSLDTSDPPAREGATVSWERHHFYYMPTIAAITLMSKMQADVRNAEADMITYLLNQVDAGSFMFNALEATVIPRSNYVFRGDDFEASVFIAAFDTTQAPEILVGQYREIELEDGSIDYEIVGRADTLPVEQGKGIYRTRPATLGDQRWGGLIRLRAPDGSFISRPFESEYTVAESHLIVSPTAMNVFYTAIDNPVEISVPGLGADQITASINNGTLRRVRGSEYVVVPARTGTAQVSVTATIDGVTRSMGSRNFRVRSVPPPVATVAGQERGVIARGVLLAQTGVLAEMRDFDFDLTYTVTRFTVSTTIGGFLREEPSTSNRITDAQRELIRSASRGSRIFFDGIRAVGPGGEERPLPTISFTLD